MEQREAEFARSSAPYFRVPPWAPTDLADWTALADKEAHIRPVFSGSAPVEGSDIPLPPGNWTVVSIGPEPVRGPPAATGILLARLDDHAATGFVLIRTSTHGSTTALPEANPMCAYPRRYARAILSPPGGTGEACWYIAEATGPFLSWDMVVDPPALGIGLKTMKRDADQLPVLLVGATYFHATPSGWFEATYFFDPLANDVRDGGPIGGWEPQAGLTDPTMAAFIAKLAAWMTGLTPLLEHPGRSPVPPARLQAANANAPA